MIDKEEFIELSINGMLSKDLATHFKVSERTVSRRRKEWDIQSYSLWVPEELSILRKQAELGLSSLEISKIISRTELAINKMASINNIKIKANRGKDPDIFLTELYHKNNTVTVLGSYSGNKTHIKCMCNICNHIWSPTPNKLLSGRGCPLCAINPKTSKYVYLLYFESLDLYKIGISTNIARRRKELGVASKLIFNLYFKNGREAYLLEQKWLINVSDLKINTGLLKSGNTETFIY